MWSLININPISSASHCLVGAVLTCTLSCVPYEAFTQHCFDLIFRRFNSLLYCSFGRKMHYIDRYPLFELDERLARNIARRNFTVWVRLGTCPLKLSWKVILHKDWYFKKNFISSYKIIWLNPCTCQAKWYLVAITAVTARLDVYRYTRYDNA